MRSLNCFNYKDINDLSAKTCIPGHLDDCPTTNLTHTQRYHQMAWMMEIPLYPLTCTLPTLSLYTHNLYLDDCPTTNRTHARIPPVAWMKCLPNTNVTWLKQLRLLVLDLEKMMSYGPPSLDVCTPCYK